MIEIKGDDKTMREQCESCNYHEKGWCCLEPIPIQRTGITAACRHFKTTKTRNPTASTKSPVLDFLALYSLFPRKEGKEAGLRQCRLQIDNLGQYERLKLAILKYRELCETEGREKKYIKIFSSFMGTRDKQTWKNYLDTDVGSTNLVTADPMAALRDKYGVEEDDNN